MRLSLNVIPDVPIGDVVALAAGAEASGYDRCWVYDEGLATRDVYVTLASIGLATDRLEIGPGITNPYTRHVGQTAAAIATLDELTGGRAFLGIGAGGSLTLDPLGTDRSRSLTAVREAIGACRALFAGETVTLDGEVVQLRGARLDGRPRADLEIWLAGRGPRMLALGGSMADGVMLDFIHQEFLADAVARVRAADPAARVCYSTAVVTEPAHLDVVRPHLTYRLVDAPAAVKERIGLADRDVDRLRAAMAGGLAAAAPLVRDEWILPFVVHGTPAECGAAIAEAADRHGIEEFLVPVFAMDDPAAYLAMVAAATGR